eukprot:scaffold952_cov149-Cylindrotheca_fusiformis.AAC.3
MGCTSLTIVKIPSTVPLLDCKRLKKLTLKEGLEQVGEFFFWMRMSDGSEHPEIRPCDWYWCVPPLCELGEALSGSRT